MEITNLDLEQRVQHLEDLMLLVGATAVEKIFPIGAVYITFSEENPQDILGVGEWVQVKDKFLLAVGDIYESMPEGVGGSDIHSHNLDSNLDPSSTAFAKIDVGSVNVLYTSINNDYSYDTTNSYSYNAPTVENISNRSNGLALGGNTGNGNNMPPYISVYIWYRIH